MTDRFVETSIKKIKEASENNKLVVFVGAGVSANSGIPTWRELITDMASDLKDFSDKISSDMYLKIPQYYYNERGEKEYFDKLNEVFFSKKFKTNPIHKEIFKLKPAHIITTNYDNLLEDAAIENGYFYHTVRQDSDLPYNNLNKTIIKMHGDFYNRNIVLKEDDYLNYSTNFTLIENYLKSLIATNTVLFIGYSISDPNFNLIFQWVKNILKKDFQPAYLIESSTEYSRLEHTYYKSRGINILFYKELEDLQEDHIFGYDNWRGNQLFSVIKHFNEFNIDKNLSELSYLYNKISNFEKLNFIMPEQIIKSLNLKSISYDSFGDRTITCFENENVLLKIFSNSDRFKDNVLFKKICDIFKKANIRGITNGREPIFIIEDELNHLNNLSDEIIQSDSLLVEKVKESPNNLLIEKSYYSMLKQAYIYFEEDEFLKAYNYYKTISLKSFQDKEYLTYYISEFNRKHVGFLLINTEWNKLDDNLKLEIEEIDLEEIFTKLPYKERKSLVFLKEVQDFNLIYRTQNKLRKVVRDLKKSKRTIENGGFSFNNTSNINSHTIINIWLFIKANYLCLDKYTEIQSLYTSFIEGVFASYSTGLKNNPKGFYSDLKINKIDELDLFSVYVIITKLETKELKNILDDYKLKEINIDEESLDYLLRVLDKIIAGIKGGSHKHKCENYLYNLLTLLSKLNLDQSVVEIINEKILDLLSSKMYIEEFDYVNIFIVSLANRNLITQKIVVKYIIKYLNVYLKNRTIWDYSKKFYRNLTRIYESDNDSYIEKNIISIYLELVEQYLIKKDYNTVYKLLGEIILPIFKGIEDNQKKLILDLVINLIDDIENKDGINGNEIAFYYQVTILEILGPNEVINNKIFEYTVLKVKKNIKVMPDPVEVNLNFLTDLYRNNFIQKKNMEEFADQFKGFSEYYDLFFNSKEIDLTDVNLISYLNESEIVEVMESENIKEKLYSIIEDKLFYNESPRIKDVFDKLYSKKFK